MLPVLNNFMIS